MKIHIVGQNEYELRVIRTLLPKELDVYIHPVEHRNHIYSVSNTLASMSNYEDIMIVVFNTYTTNKEMIDDQASTARSLLRGKVFLFMPVPELKDEIGVPENLEEDYKQLTPAFIEWFKENIDVIRTKEKVKNMLDYIENNC